MEKNLKILVIDGSRVSRKVISKILMSEMHAESMEITAVGSAAEAMTLLGKQKFHLITCSILLPDMYGIDLCKAVRRTGAHRFTPFIVVTAEPHARLMKEGFSAGVTDYYDKTQGFNDFVRFIRGFAERHAGLVGKVLYLEDNFIEAKITTTIMERHGLEVIRAVSAEQALTVVDQSFDLIVADFFLQEAMSGGDFLHNIRCGLRYSREELPVLVVTGEEDRNMQAEIFHAGGNDFVTKPIIEEILISRIRSLLLIKQQFTQLKKQSEEMRKISLTDSLTGTYNKRYLLDHAQRVLSNPENFPVHVVVIDLDHFKSINDRHGHLVGDRVLEGVGKTLREAMRADDVVIRIGGEEFVALLARRTEAECANEVEDLRIRIAKLQPAGLPVTASIGVASNAFKADIDLNDILVAADEAMYRAKAAGRNQVMWAEPQRARESH